MSTFYAEYPVNGGGVSSLNGLVGALTLIGAGGITITPAGSNITITGTGGTVTSVGLADNTGLFNITGSPVTTSGTLTLASLQSQLANDVFAAPNGSNGAPTFRQLVTQDLSFFGQPNGVATLDASGKIPSSELPSTVLQYQGLWDAATNVPFLQDSTGTSGYVYQVSVAHAGAIAGLNNSTMVNFQVGNLIIYSGSIMQWEQTTPAAGVQSVNGAQGNVTVNAINQLTGDVIAGPATQSQSVSSSVVALQGTGVSATAPTIGQVLEYNGTAWTPTTFTSGANTALSNLTSTSINQDLVPNSNNNFNLGDPGFLWHNLYLASGIVGSSGTQVLNTGGQLIDTSGITSIDWTNRDLRASGFEVLLWSASGVTIGNPTSNAGALFIASSASNTFTTQISSTNNTVSWNFNLPAAAGSVGQVLTSQGGGSNAMTWSNPSTGSVTSVALADGSTTPIYSVSGSPVTSSGTLTLTLSNQTANTVFAGPTSGSAAQPTFRSLVSADIPNNAANTTGTASNVTATSNSTLTTLTVLTTASSLVTVGTITSGTWNGSLISPTYGGTGVSNPTVHGLLIAEGSSAMTSLVGAEGTLLAGQGSGSDPSFSESPTLGIPNSMNGGLYIASNAGAGRVNLQNIGTTPTDYNFNFPTTAGVSGQVLTSQGGTVDSMTWTFPGGGGSKNYLSAYTASTSSGTPNTGNGNFELGNTSGWSLAHTALSSFIPTSTATPGSAFSSSSGGTPENANLSFTANNSLNISGIYSGAYSSTTSTVAGDMVISNAFYVDAEDQAKVMTVKFYYGNASGGTANFSGTTANSFAVWIYDVTNGAWIMPAGVYGMTQSAYSSGGNADAGYCTATFQTTNNSKQYQLAIININIIATNFAILFDDFSLGPQTAPFGPSVTDWQSYTLTIGGTTSAPTPGTTSLNTAKWRRVGDSMEIFYQLIQTATGSAGSGTYLFPIPSGYSIDTTKLGISTGTGNTIGVGSITGQASGNQGPCVVIAHDTTNLTLNVYNATVNSASGEFVGSSFYSLSAFAGTIYTFTAKVPITGWSSNLQMSNDTDTRVVAMQVTQTSPTATVTGAFSLIKYTASPTQDTHGGFSTSTGLYTVPVTGFYKCSTGLGVSATYTNTTESAVAIAHNGTAINAGSQVAGAAEGSLFPFISTTIFCTAGDTLSPQVLSSGTSPTVAANTTTNFFTVERLSGPSVIAATESVNMSYTDTSGGAIGTSAGAYSFGTKLYDSHNAYSGSTYTIPVTGKYRVSATLTTNPVTLTTSEALQLYVYHNGSQYILGQALGNGASADYLAIVTGTVACNAGDTIQIFSRSGVSTTANTAANSNLLSIERVGN